MAIGPRIAAALLLALLTIIIFCYLLWRNSLYSSPLVIRERLLMATPVGASIAEVRHFLSAKRYEVVEDRDLGLSVDVAGGPSRTFGVKSIRANLGHYHLPILRTDVIAGWAFDDDGKLIEIVVRKYTDGL